MGEEIDKSEFDEDDRAEFETRLREETRCLAERFRDGTLSDEGYTWGFELEAWLLDHSFFPSPRNEALLAALDDPDVVPELSRFNVELNTAVRGFEPDTLLAAERELKALWDRCNAVAHTLDINMVMIGTLPTIRDQDLSLRNISQMKRYYALNSEILRAHHGRPIEVDIEGPERLHVRHRDVMLEAAATSFQIHLKMPVSLAHHYLNASMMISAPVLAASVNAPLLFDRLLWAETRIALFEQSIAGVAPATGELARVTFGSGFVEPSLMASFEENLGGYAVLLPILFDEPPAALRHLRLHNGTIWRWNRPLVAVDGPDPHVRIEHRVLPAGPSLVDMIANSALYLGLVHEWVMRERHVPASFGLARENFYAAARHGLDAVFRLDGREVDARRWLLDELLGVADAGLARFGISVEVRDRYLSVLERRVASGQTGARWQRDRYLAEGRHAYKLMAAYCECQRSGLPVHEWPA